MAPARKRGWRPVPRSLALRCVVAVAAAAAVAFVIATIWSSLGGVRNAMPQYGFFAIRDIHVTIRNVSDLKDAVEMARLAPTAPEALERLSEANDLAFIRFVRQSRRDIEGSIPAYPAFNRTVQDLVGRLDEVLSRGLPLDSARLAEIGAELVLVEADMSRAYAEFGERTNAALLAGQATLTALKVEIAAVLITLALLTFGTALLLAKRQESLKELERRVWHDGLTGLRNRAWLMQELDRMLAGAVAASRPFKLAIIDLDRFKDINDTYGHQVGDRMLQESAALIRSTLKPGDVPIRLSGDEFAVAVFDEPEGAEATESRIAARFEMPLALDGHQIRTTVSIGVARFPEHGDHPDVLLRHADYALYAAKDAGRARAVVFEPRFADAFDGRLRIEAGLKRALGEGELFLVWQPQFDLARGRLDGAEALVRWRDAETGELVPPHVFIPVAERSGLVLDVDATVLRLACLQAAAWRRAGEGVLSVSVNISGSHLERPGLDETVAAALAESGLPGSALELEITESALIGNRQVAESTIRSLQQMGVRLALDDFGTGYSSLSYLADLRVDRLKIDRSFVDGMERSERKRSIVGSIMALARLLKMDVVAEGVETEEQLAILREQGCRYAQGFLLSPPVDASAVGSAGADLEPLQASRDRVGLRDPILSAKRPVAA